MKKLWFFLAMFVCVLASCSDGGSDDPSNPTPKPEEVKTEITIDSNIVTNGLSFDAETGEKYLSFSVNANWTLSIASTTSGTTWCKASATSGSKGSSKVKFTVDENASYDDRSVSITIKAGTVSKTFTITQKGADAMLVTTAKYEVAQEGGKIEIEVKANIDYQFVVSETVKDWITETKSKSRGLTTYKHSFDIAMNEDAEKREGEITFKSGDKVETVKVYQAGGAIILLTQDEYIVSDAGEMITVDIKSNIEFGVQMPDVDWIVDEASSRGMSSHTLNYYIEPNEGYDSRSAEIIFFDKNSNLQDTLKVIQAQKDAIVISQTEYTIPEEGGTLDFEVSSNVEFNTEISVDWIKQVTTSRSLENKQLHFTVDENTDGSVREGSITFTYGDLLQIVKVKQEAEEIPYLTFTAEEEQSLTMSMAVPTLQYSLNGEEWVDLGDKTVTFGGEKGALQVRGKSPYGTASSRSSNESATIQFDNAIPVYCTGEIRTLVDYESYKTVDTSNARFCFLFLNCKSLVTAPELPATILAEYCYSSMFDGCNSLTEAPELPATTLTEYCYSNMFYDCESLKEAPNLPATTLAKSCYESMFNSCKSLTDVPELPVTTLAEGCYSNMFALCESLTDAPELPATTLAPGCYYSMFYGCESLKEAPELPATTLVNGCYSWMFYGCESLKEAPELPATTLAYGCYRGMFRGCESLKEAPELPATTLAEYCYEVMFSGCKSLTEAPNLPATTLAKSCYSSMFYGCNSLTEAPNLPATILAVWCYQGMFDGCESLIKAPELPATTLAECCYEGMFISCKSLTEAPVLPATTLVNGCYSSMFKGCKSLNKVTMLATTDVNNSFSQWLYGVSSNGTFVKAKNQNNLQMGANGIPWGWTVVDYEE